MSECAAWIFGLILLNAEYAWKKEGQRSEVYAAHFIISGSYWSYQCV